MSRQIKTSTRRWMPLVAFLALAVAPADAQIFTKVFTPSTIGPGSVSTITFTITNNTGGTITGLNFTDPLPTVPGDVDIADPANASTTCLDGVVTAPDGGGTISLSDGRLGIGETCTVTVDVTASTPGVHTNGAIILFYNELSGDPPMSSPVNLTVVTTLPGFSKSFAPSSISLGETSTLTFTIDNGANAAPVGNLEFTDNLPIGMVVADPSNATTDCISAGFPDTTVTATPGTSVIDLDAFGSTLFPGFEVLPIGATCTVTVDVMGVGIGMLDNVTNDLRADFTFAGKASDTLEVTVTRLAIQKDFIDDPTPPGSTATLEFRIDNFDRNFPATDVAFTDDLTTLVPALPGAIFDSEISNDCGVPVSGIGGTTLSLSGVTIPAEGFCTIQVTVSVPAGAMPGSYTNTTSTVTGTVDSSPVVGNTASADLFVEPVPILTKEFLEVGTFAPDPIVNPGDSVILQFTVTNTSTTSGATDVAFIDELTDGGPGTGFLPLPLSVALPPVPNPPCGAGSTLGFVFPDTERQGLSLTGGSLAAAGMAGDSCTFYVTVTIPAPFPPGIYLNTTEEPSATVDGATRIGDPSSDTLTVIAAPSLTKAFTDDPVAPGDTVTLELELNYSANATGDAIDITFTDNLAPVLAGLTATGLPITEACDPDGPGGDPGTGTLSGSAGDTLLTLMGATLSPGESCVISVTLAVPAGAASGAYTNTTSGIAATVGGQAATSPAASDDLEVGGMIFSKEFLGDPAFPGKALTLRFNLENISAVTATAIGFTDSLFPVAGLIATDPALADDCGGTLTIITIPGLGSSLTYAGGTLAAGMTCTLDVEVTVPTTASDGIFENFVSGVSYMLGATPGFDGPAIDNLIVDSDQITLFKAFTDDPVAPGNTVTLEFNLVNLDSDNPASAIAFTDDLDTTLTGLTYDSLDFNDCGGSVTGLGTGLITVSGASLAADGSCTIRVTLSVPAGAAADFYTNTTSGVTGDIDGNTVTGDPASDTLEVIQLLTFSKSFDGPTTATGTATLTFTITNPGADTASDIEFTDDLNAVIPGLIATGLPALPCGASSEITGIGFLAFSGGELPPMGGTCTFDVEVLVPVSATAGTFPNVTSDLQRAGLLVADPATADLAIEPPPTFAKVFVPDAILAGSTSTLTFTIDNSASALTASSLAFIDNLPASVVITTPSVTSNTCGGTLTANAGGTSIELTGGSVGAGASCTIEVNVTSIVSGSHVNTTDDLTSTSGNSGDATDTLTVNPAADLSVTKDDGEVEATPGGTVTYTITVTNPGPSADPSVTLTDTFPSPPLSNCTYTSSTTGGATGNTSPGSGDLAETLSMPASSSVTYMVTCDIDADATGTLSNTATIAPSITDTVPGNNSATDNNTVLVPETDLSITKSDSPDPVTAGENLTYTLTVTNNGPSDSTGATVTDVLPAGVTFSSSSDCTEAGGTVTCAIGALTVSDSEMVSFVVTVDPGQTAALSNTATVAANETDSTSGNDSATEGTTVQAETDLSITKSDSPDPVTAGEDLTYTLTVTNNGPSDSTGATVTDVLPAGVTFSSSSDCTEAGGTVTCAIGTLAVSASEMVSFTVTVDSGQTAALSNTASVAANETDSTTGNDSATEGTTVEVETDLSITKSDSPDPVNAGEDLTYTLTVTNNGPSDSTGATVTDVLPAGVTFNSSSDCTEAGGTVTCAIGALAASDSEMVSFIVTVDPGQTTAIDNTASVAANETDSTSGNDSDTESTSIGVETDLSITKDDSPDPVVAGEDLTYTLTVTNNGPSDSTGATVTDDLPMGVTFSSSSDCTEAGGTVTCAIGSLASGDSEVVSFVVTVDPDQTAPISNTASVAANETDSTSTNDEATATTTVGTESGLSITKGGSPDPVTAGESLTYTLEVSNAGPSDAADVMVFDLLPEEASYSSDTDSCTQPADLTGLRAELDASQEVPPVASSATGLAVFVLDTSTNELKFAIHVESIDGISGAQIYSGAAGTNGAIVQFLYDGTPVFDPGNPITGTIQLSAAEAASLLADPHYVNVLTTDFPSGEIRGQIEVTAQTPLLCSLGTIAAGDSASFDVVTDVASDTADGSVLRNVAIVMSSSTDPDAVSLPAPNGTGVLTGATAEVQTSVATTADLMITKTDGVTSASPGESVTYTIVVSNLGSSDDSTVTVTDIFTKELTCTWTSSAVGGASGNTAAGSGDISDTLSMPVGSEVTYTATCAIAADAIGTLVNVATVSGSIDDPDTGNNSAVDNDTVLAGEADLVIKKTDNGDTAIPGETLTYITTAGNNGPSDEPAATVTDIFPAELTCTWTSTTEDGAGGNTPAGSGDINDTLSLPVGGAVTYTAECVIAPDAVGTLVNVATITASAGDPDTSNNTEIDETLLEPEADLSVTKTDGVTAATPGETVTYTIVASNDGPSTDPAATVADVFPADLTCTWTSSADGGATGNTAAGSGDISDTLSLPPSSSVTYTAECTIDSTATGTLSNTATVTASVDDPDTGNNSATDDDTVLGATADLGITKTDGVDEAAAGGSLTYTIVASNDGPSDDPSVSVTDVFPEELECTWTSIADGGATGNTPAGSGDIDDTLSMPAGSSVTYTAECIIDRFATGTISNTATVAGSVEDPDSGNNSATDETLLVGEADLEIAKEGPESVGVGEQLTYTLTVTNNGPSAVDAVTVEDPTPAGLEFVSATAPCEGGLPCDLGTLAPDDEVVIEVTFEVPFSYDGPSPIVNTATVSGETIDPDPGNDSASAETDVVFDEVPPVVTGIETASGPLAACDTLRSPITRIEVTIEDDLTPIENAGVASSYLLVEAGADGDFSTSDCDGPSGDDVAIEIVSLSLESTPTTAVAGLNFPDGLEAGLYSLVVCDEITDAAGNALDGDGDATPGGDFFLSFFRADPLNQFENGHFDACPSVLGPVTLDPWMVVATPPNTITPSTPGADDSELSPLSASARVSHSVAATSSLAQCVAVDAGVVYDLVSRWRFEPPMDAMARLEQTCEFFDGPSCTGISLGTSSTAEVLEDDGGVWNMLSGEVVAAAGAVSALCDFAVDPVGTDPNFDVYLDGLSLFSESLPAVIFIDGFESGDTSAWSATVDP